LAPEMKGGKKEEGARIPPHRATEEGEIQRGISIISNRVDRGGEIGEERKKERDPRRLFFEEKSSKIWS